MAGTVILLTRLNLCFFFGNKVKHYFRNTKPGQKTQALLNISLSRRKTRELKVNSCSHTVIAEIHSAKLESFCDWTHWYSHWKYFERQYMLSTKFYWYQVLIAMYRRYCRQSRSIVKHFLIRNLYGNWPHVVISGETSKIYGHLKFSKEVIARSCSSKNEFCKQLQNLQVNTYIGFLFQ